MKYEKNKRKKKLIKFIKLKSYLMKITYILNRADWQGYGQ